MGQCPPSLNTLLPKANGYDLSLVVFTANRFGVGFQMRTNPTADQLGFSSGQFEIILEYDDATIENSSFIFLPNNALNQQPGTNKVTITLFNAN